MYIVRILKRKDASSVVVAVVLALILLTPINVLTTDLAQYLSGITDYVNIPWREGVVLPIVQSFLEVILLEAILRAVIAIRPLFVRHATRSTKK
ncbi:hypothetical protein KC867_02925 [Candidatus Saccharibacteria bacterium]|nr:hypothetical protein [Candidatus Saccharibacteria bacterium]